MKYLLKALNTNNRDLKTAILFSIVEGKDQNYLFNCPDGFQRVANLQKMKFGKVKFVFVPSLSPDHFAGFPGFFLSAREAASCDANMQQNMRMVLIAPKDAHKVM